MGWTEMQKEEIEKVMDVCADYIKNSRHFDVVWSEKVGYVLLKGLSTDMDSFAMEPEILRDGETLCDQVFYEIACDILEKNGKYHDLEDCSAEERKDICRSIEPYLKRLPEYADLLERLFLER